MTKREIVDVEITFYGETEKAWGVWEGKYQSNGEKLIVWLPKSLIDRDGATFTGPEWLKEKGVR